MPTKTHCRQRPSLDRVDDLLADLDDNQITLLLEDLNHTADSNVPVSEAIDFFEAPSPAKAKRFSLLRDRLSKRISSAPAAAPRYDAAPARPKTAVQPTPAQAQAAPSSRPRGYKRISRPVPMLPSMIATPDLHDLLAAYLSDTPLDLASSVSSMSSSPASSRSASAFSSFSGDEDIGPWADLLEPSPMRSREATLSFGAMREPSRNISGIFEVLSSV